MSSEYTELQSYSGLDAAVDQLFRAYLDTKLMECRKDAFAGGKFDSTVYKDKVIQLRKAQIDPFTLTEAEKQVARGDTDALKKQAQATRNAAAQAFTAKKEGFEYARRFLYWFDLRATFWGEDTVHDELLKALLSAEALAQLVAEGKALAARLTHAQAVVATQQAATLTAQALSQALSGSGYVRPHTVVADAGAQATATLVRSARQARVAALVTALEAIPKYP